MITFRPHQTAAVDAVEDAYRAGMKRPLVDACVGSGKSLMMAELARRAWVDRGERSIILAPSRELVEQDATAGRMLGLDVGINCAALDQCSWRSSVIVASIQSVYRNTRAFGPVQNILSDEAHLWPHTESGMLREFLRGFPDARAPGFSGTVFRLQGGSLVEGEGAPFQSVVYQYGITDGIRDEYLVPAFSAGADDKMDPTKLKTRQGEFTGDSQDAQMFALMDSHIAQMVHHGRDRRAWLVFEASTKAAKAMVERLQQWGVSTGLVLGTTPAAERAATIAAFRAGRLRCLVNVSALTTGFDVQEVDMLVMRRRTKSLGLYIQMCGRLLRTIGGNLTASIAAGKADGIVLDFAGNIDQHGPLDFIRPKDTVLRMVSCESCSARNAGAAMRCWACDEPMTKLCPHCLGTVVKGTLDCPHCGYDMRTGAAEAGREPQKLLETPTGAALISSYSKGKEREGGWLPIAKVWRDDTDTFVKAGESMHQLSGLLATHAADARWIRSDDNGEVTGLLLPNGSNRNTVLHVAADGMVLPIPMPPYSEL